MARQLTLACLALFPGIGTLPGQDAQEPSLVHGAVAVDLPSAYDPRARHLYEQMATELPDFDARKVVAAESERQHPEKAA